MQLHPILKATALGVLLASVVARPAHAVDGVIEINQTRAKAGGVTPGDTPLFPVTIDQPGSYRLTGNLDVTDASARPGGTLAENTTAILVTADGVTIDLNGFTIVGPTTCSGPPVSCTPVGTGIGIDANRTAIGVMNGSVRGMGSHGVVLGRTSQAERIRVEGNGENGIQAVTSGPAGTLLSNCTARLNGNTGLIAVTMINSSASLNGQGGLTGITATGCTADQNGGTGFQGFTVTNSTSFGNGSDGIFSNGTVANCVANGNKGDGIRATTVSGSTADGNDGVGIRATAVTGSEANGNTAGQIVASGVDGHNVCTGGVPCP